MIAQTRPMPLANGGMVTEKSKPFINIISARRAIEF
jgi:hypothetical protein